LLIAPLMHVQYKNSTQLETTAAETLNFA